MLRLFFLIILAVFLPAFYLSAHETPETPCTTIDINDQQFVEDLTQLKLENEALRNQITEFEQRLGVLAGQISEGAEESLASEEPTSNDAQELKKMLNEAKRVLVDQGKTIETLDMERESLTLEVNDLKEEQEESSGKLKKQEQQLNSLTLERDQLKQEVDKYKQ